MCNIYEDSHKLTADLSLLKDYEESIIEKHYGFLTADEVAEGLRNMQAFIRDGGVRTCYDNEPEFIKRFGRRESEEDFNKRVELNKGVTNSLSEEFLEKYNKAIKDMNNHTLDTAGYLCGGSPHIPFEGKSAVKSAMDIHDKIMNLNFLPTEAKKHISKDFSLFCQSLKHIIKKNEKG